METTPTTTIIDIALRAVYGPPPRAAQRRAAERRIEKFLNKKSIRDVWVDRGSVSYLDAAGYLTWHAVDVPWHIARLLPHYGRAAASSAVSGLAGLAVDDAIGIVRYFAGHPAAPTLDGLHAIYRKYGQ